MYVKRTMRHAGLICAGLLYASSAGAGTLKAPCLDLGIGQPAPKAVRALKGYESATLQGLSRSLGRAKSDRSKGAKAEPDRLTLAQALEAARRARAIRQRLEAWNAGL